MARAAIPAAMPEVRAARRGLATYFAGAIERPALAVALTLTACSSPGASDPPASEPVERIERIEPVAPRPPAASAPSTEPSGSTLAAPEDPEVPPDIALGSDPMEALRLLMDSAGEPPPDLPPGPLPEVELGDATVERSAELTAETVRRVVHRHLRELEICYAIQLAHTPTLAGHLRVDFTVTPTGAVDAVERGVARVEGERDVVTSLERCVHTAFARWTFPALEGGASATVRQPLDFTPGPPSPGGPAPRSGLDVAGS